MGNKGDLQNNTFNLQEFRMLFNDYYKQIRNFIYYKTGEIELSEDIAQECFLRMWEHRDRIKNETAKSYLYTIANNLSINHLKKQTVVLKFMNRKFKQNHAETPHFVLEEKEFDQQLQHTLGQLTDKQRTVFLMNRIDGMTYVEIADALGISVKAVEKRMNAALIYLRENIAQKI